MNARSGRTPIEILSVALTHFEIARSHASRDLEEQITIDAICMRLSAGVESLSKLDEATRAATFGSSCSAMWGCGTESPTAICSLTRALCAGRRSRIFLTSSPRSAEPSSALRHRAESCGSGRRPPMDVKISRREMAFGVG